MSRWVETNLPCDSCGSSDALSVDKEGRAFCFSCNELFPHYGEGHKEVVEVGPRESPPGEFRYASYRGIPEHVMEFYNIKSKFVDDELHEIGFIYANKSAKIRNLTIDKKEKGHFRTQGDIGKSGLFGMDKFDPGSKESITITEGEFDAPSIYHVTAGRTAAVSVQSSVTAKRDCVAQKDYIDSFKKIILCFDSDEKGQNAARSIASLFDFKKVYVVKFSRHKDANDYLQANEGKELYAAWNGARRYAPDNLVSSFSEIKALLAEKRDKPYGTYPIRSLQDALHGLHGGEVVLFKGMEGIGKTEILRLMEYHLLQTTKHPIGVMHLEESTGETIKRLVTYEMKAPAAMDESGITDEEIFEAYSKIVGGSEDRLFIRKSYDLDDIQNIIDMIRFMVAGSGCKVIFFDHISWLAAASESDNERQKLDVMIQRLKLLAEELNFCLVLISHVNDDGKTRGSRYITKASNTVIDLSRDVTAADFEERMKLFFHIEKSRGQGTSSGPAGWARYNVDTYCLEDGDY